MNVMNTSREIGMKEGECKHDRQKSSREHRNQHYEYKEYRVHKERALRREINGDEAYSGIEELV